MGKTIELCDLNHYTVREEGPLPPGWLCETCKSEARVKELETELEHIKDDTLSIVLPDGSKLRLGDAFTVRDTYPFFNEKDENYNAIMQWSGFSLWYEIYRVSDRVAGCCVDGSMEDLEDVFDKIEKRPKP